MRALNLAHRVFGLARSVAYTGLIRLEFAELGLLSVFDPPSKLVEPHLIRIGNRVRVCEHAWLNAKDTRGDGMPTLTIGDGTYIGRFVHINAWQDVVIEHDVLIADRVFITDADHNYEDVHVPVRRQGDRFKGPVRLKTGCWLGIGVVVLPGVTIGANAVVAANSVVTKDVPDRAVVAGIPAKTIKIRE